MNGIVQKSYLPAVIYLAIGMGIFLLSSENVQRHLQYPLAVFFIVFIIMFVRATRTDASRHENSAAVGLWSAKTALSALCFLLVFALAFILQILPSPPVLKVMLLCLQLMALFFYIFFVVF